MHPVRVIALAWLVSIAAWFYGVWSVRDELWPYSLLQDVEAFLAGDAEESTTLTEKIENDVGLVPARHLVTPAPAMPYPREQYRDLDELPLADDREPPFFYLSPDAPRGYRVIYGVFDFRDRLHGAILLGPDGDLVRVWQTTQEADWSHLPDENVYPHGFDITRQGEILTAYDHGTSLTKYGYCGNEVWRLKGGFHHSIELMDGDGTFWTWGNEGSARQFGIVLQQIAVENGAILRSFDIEDIIRANLAIDIFAIRQKDYEDHADWVMEGGGPFHPNDVDPLPAHLAGYYPGFDAGDLLVSMRSINLIFVMDPETLKVKWWRSGLARRQHDPDWNDRGTITILNNNMHKNASNIIELNPFTLAARNVLQGSYHGFYSWNRGKHDRLPNGFLLVTSSAQGRVFESSPEGFVSFDFHNLYNEDAGALTLSEARFLPMDYFEDLPTCDD